MQGVRCGTKELGLHPEESKEPPKGWDGHPRPADVSTLENEHREATEKAAADSRVRANSGQKESRGTPSENSRAPRRS